NRRTGVAKLPGLPHPAAYAAGSPGTILRGSSPILFIDAPRSPAARASRGWTAALGQDREAFMTREELDGERVFVIHDFLPPEECADLIRRSDSLEYETGTVAGVVAEH